jgi:hypothetical protein
MRSDAVMLHFADLPVMDVVERPGFRVTTPLRSLIDVATSAPDEDQLARAIGEARGSGLVTPRQLRVRAEAVDARAALIIERALQRVESP